MVSTETEVSADKSSSGMEIVRYENVCKIRPGLGKNSCSYLLATDRVNNVNIKLISWTRNTQSVASIDGFVEMAQTEAHELDDEMFVRRSLSIEKPVREVGEEVLGCGAE
jgi:hypothetical protein